MLDAKFALSLGARITIYNASSFHRRIVDPLQQFPLVLLQFASGNSEKITELATSLLAAKRLHVTACKFRDLFRSELEELKKKPVLKHDRLGILIEGLTKFGEADVRDSERTNKAIKLQETRCPNIGCDLLSSRVVLKHFMGETCEGAGLQKKKWSLFRGVAEKLKNMCLSGWQDKSEVMNRPDRWTPPSPHSSLPSLEMVKKDRCLNPKNKICKQTFLTLNAFFLLRDVLKIILYLSGI